MGLQCPGITSRDRIELYFVVEISLHGATVRPDGFAHFLKKKSATVQKPSVPTQPGPFSSTH